MAQDGAVPGDEPQAKPGAEQSAPNEQVNEGATPGDNVAQSGPPEVGPTPGCLPARAVATDALAVGLQGCSLFRQRSAANIASPAHEERHWWDKAQWMAMVTKVGQSVCTDAQGMIDWYARAKEEKKPRATVARGAALFFALWAAWCTVVSQLGSPYPRGMALAVLLASGCILTDSVMGWTQGYLRYEKARERIQGMLGAFYREWDLALLEAGCANGGAQLTCDQTKKLLTMAYDFRLAVQGVVNQETQQWANDFRAGLDQVDALLGKNRNGAAGTTGGSAAHTAHTAQGQGDGPSPAGAPNGGAPAA